MEPLEEVVCEVEDEYSGAIIEALSLRKGEVRLRLLLALHTFALRAKPMSQCGFILSWVATCSCLR